MTTKVSSIPGKFSYENTPYTREIADCFSKNSSVREVAVMKGVQLGFTTAVFENIIGYSIDYDPCPMMMVSGDLKLLRDFKTIKISTMIDNSNLRNKITAETENRHSRRTGDTAEMMDFLGGFLRIAGCHNGNSLRSLPIKKLFLDEVDAYPLEIKGEGSPIDLAVKRTESYSRNRNIGYISTPTMSHRSKIKELYEKGDQRKYFVPCPLCGKMQELEFYQQDGGLYGNDKAIAVDNEQLTIDNEIGNKNNLSRSDSLCNFQLSTFNFQLLKPFGIIFNSEECKGGNYASVGYRCKHCGEVIREFQKRAMLNKGVWIPTAKPKKPRYRSYHLSALYSLFKSWEDCVVDFLDVGRDPIKLQSFYNLTLGLPFEEYGEGVEIYKLQRLREEERNNNIIPEEALFLVGACDIQDDRLEIEIKAYGDRFRSWGVDHRVIKGNTSDQNDPCWEELKKIRDETWNGFTVNAIVIDSGDGEKTDLVYNFCLNDGENVFIPLKGVNNYSNQRKKYNYKQIEGYPQGFCLLEIYVNQYKNQLSRILNGEWREGEEYPDGYMTFARDYTDEYFRQLTTEKKVKEKLPNGTIAYKWTQHGRNEAFDLNVYCLCFAEKAVNDFVIEQGLKTAREAFELIKNNRR
jgi:phage terminase large subunit GpA-like protein